MPYRIEFSPEAREHLRELTARQRSIIADAVEDQLTHQPSTETRNRKEMRANRLAPWELRVGRLRVYYEVQDTDDPVVLVRAIGVKERDQVWIVGQPFRF